jgi:Tol biopolymer transport system component
MWRFPLLAVVAVSLLAPAPSGGSPSPSPEQPLLAFTRGGDIWTIRGDGAGARLLLRNGYAPAWSPDGSRLAFVSRRSGDEELWVARADGSEPRRLTRSPGPDLTPAWSPDGKQLAWSRDREIWTMRADGLRKRRLVARTRQWHEHYSPTWHGRTIVYSSNRVSSFNPELFRVGVGGTGTKRLTFTAGSDGVLGDDGMPDFSPDGKRIAFTSNRDRNGEVYVMNADGSRQRRLTRKPGDDFSPRFSPDGTRIAFTALPGSVYLVNADGTGLRRLTAGTDPDWRP